MPRIRLKLLFAGLLFGLSLGPLGAQNLEEDEWLVDEDEGGGSVTMLVPAYDPTSKSGSLLSLSPEGHANAIQERAREVIQTIHPFEIDKVPYFLVLWRSLDQPARSHPEIWKIQGYESLVWGGVPRVTWWDARLLLRKSKGKWALSVVRSLALENRQQPPLRRRETYILEEKGPKRIQARTAPVQNPAQQLNFAAELGVDREYEEMVQAIRKLPRNPPEYLERAAVLMTRYGKGGIFAETSKGLLESLGRSTQNPRSLRRAANRILEMEAETPPPAQPLHEQSSEDGSEIPE